MKRIKYNPKKIIQEDLRILQRKISGASVYRSKSFHYKRKPKHKKSLKYQLYQY